MSLSFNTVALATNMALCPFAAAAANSAKPVSRRCAHSRAATMTLSLCAGYLTKKNVKHYEYRWVHHGIIGCRNYIQNESVISDVSSVINSDL